MTFTVPIPIPIPTHSHDSTLFPFPFFPDTTIYNSHSHSYKYYFEITKAEKCRLNYEDKYSTNTTTLYHHLVIFPLLLFNICLEYSVTEYTKAHYSTTDTTSRTTFILRFFHTLKIRYSHSCCIILIPIPILIMSHMAIPISMGFPWDFPLPCTPLVYCSSVISATAAELQWLETWTRPGASDLERVPSRSCLSDTETLTRASVDVDPRCPATGTGAPAWLPSSSVEIRLWYQPRLSSSVSRMSWQSG